MALCHRYRSQLLGDSLSVRRGKAAAIETPKPGDVPPESGDGRRYDRAYFDRWYRHPTHRVKTATELARQLNFVLHTAEWVLGRPVRTVLDVGCGEGNWQPVLKKLRPNIEYDGVDPSAYAVERFGSRRGLQQGSIEALDALQLRAGYDLVVCCGMLNYLSAAQFRRGAAQVAQRVGGVAYLEIFAKGDAFEGDTDWPRPKSAEWYRGVLGRTGLRSIGMQCYVTDARKSLIARMERGW